MRKRASRTVAVSAIIAFMVSVAGAASLVVASSGTDGGAQAAQPARLAVSASGLPLPRFVSLKSGKVNVRVGPGGDYDVAWVFTRAEHPVEIIQEWNNWRRIRDSDGSVGWVFHSLLSGKRTAVVTPWAGEGSHPIRAAAQESARITAYLQTGVMGSVDRCRDSWCEISGDDFSGWIEQNQLWGVYQNEVID